MVDICANVILDIKVTVQHVMTLTNVPRVLTTAMQTPNAQIITVPFHVAACLATKETVEVALISMNALLEAITVILEHFVPILKVGSIVLVTTDIPEMV